ncbi:MAG: hypothetical protein ACOCP4_07490 [Candidatus Woesearchaeota archaeon]
MKDLVALKLEYIDKISDELISSVNKVFNDLIEKAKELEIWDDSVVKIVVTDNLSEEIHKQAELWNIKTEITKAKEYSVISKILFNHNLETPEHVLFIDFSILLNENYSIAEIFFKQVITTKAKWLFPKEILDIQFTPQPKTLDTYITVSAIEWIKTYYSSKTINQIFENPSPPMNHNSFLNAFKRSLKRDLFKYNTDKLSPDENLAIFWDNYNRNFHNFFLRICENETENKELLIKEKDCKKLVYNVFDEIKKLTTELNEKGSFNILNLKEKFKKFSSFFEIHLEEDTKDNFRIRLTKNPKEYFKDLVDTEPRIICFLDILGFSDFVYRYENDVTSTFLQDIQESFALAREQLLDNKNMPNKEAIEHLEYQTFSDNISISIPYFDNENDFLSNFNILSIYVRGLQMIMMSKGFFVRGGISIGSYYADNSIIFSQGLINAYKLESEKAIYPRILIDKVIIDEILNYRESKIEDFGLKKAIIFDWESQAFLNPIGLIDSSLQHFNSIIIDNLEQNDDDQFSSIINSFTKSIGKMATDLLNTASDKEKENLVLIKRYINHYLQENMQNERIYSKYLWLNELFKWLENDGTENLKFRYLSEYYENE